MEGAVTMEMILTLTFAHSGDEAEADVILDAFLSVHPEASPVVGENVKEGTIDITVSVEADDPYAAAEVGRSVLTDGLNASGVQHRPIVSIKIEPVDQEDQASHEDRELEPA